MKTLQFQKREAVVDLYRLILDRDPESEQVINEKRKSKSLQEISRDMLMSEEFIRKNEDMIRDALY
jgi:hypothetical protein